MESAVKRKVLLCSLLFLFLTGCAPGIEQTERAILERDPGFADILARRDLLRERLAEGRGSVDRDERRQIRAEVEAMREHLKQELRYLENTRRSVRLQLYSLRNDLGRYELIRKERERIARPGEMDRWHESFLELSRNKEEALRRLDEVEARITLTKKKIRVMRL